MKKCVLSILVAIIMIISMMPTAFGATTKVALTVEASSATANVNDELTFTLYIQTFEDGTVSGFDLPINVPAGLTYVPNSGKVSDTFKETCKAENFEWIESGAKFFCASSELDGLANLNAKQAIGTFKCKVDNDASGSYNVGVSITAIEDKDVVNISNADYLVNTPATVNIAAAPTTYTVKVNGGTGVTVNSTQTVNQGEAITDVVIEAWDNYYFPEGYGENSGGSGIVVTRNSPSKITVSGTPTADVTINLPAAAMKAENPNIPSVTPVHCTAAGNDGKITGVDASMEYKKGAIGDTWYIVGNNTEITGLASGTYYVRYKATATQKASAAAEVVINDYDPTVEKVTVTYKANGGTGADHSVQVDKGSSHVILGADACHFTAPAGERFVYWSTRADNATGSTHYAAGQELRNLQSDLTLYAVWETTDRTVFLNAGEGGGDEISETVTYDQTYTLPGVPETFTAPMVRNSTAGRFRATTPILPITPAIPTP